MQVSDPEVDSTQPAASSQGDLRKRTKQQELKDRKQEMRLDGANTLVSVPLATQHIEGTAHFGTLDTLVSSGQSGGVWHVAACGALEGRLMVVAGMRRCTTSEQQPRLARWPRAAGQGCRPRAMSAIIAKAASRGGSWRLLQRHSMLLSK